MPRHNKPKPSRAKRKRQARARDASAARLAQSSKHKLSNRVIEARARDAAANGAVPNSREMRSLWGTGEDRGNPAAMTRLQREVHDLSKIAPPQKRRV